MRQAGAVTTDLGSTRKAGRVSIDPTLLDDLEWRGLIAHSTDRRRAPRGAPRRERQVLRGLRPDRAEPPHGPPGAGPHRPPTAAGGPHAVRARRRRDRHDRRPQGRGGAQPQLARRRQGVGRQGARPDRAVPLLRGAQRGHDGQQLRLDRHAVDDRLPARHRQALPGQPDAGPRGRRPAARVGHQLHRVQLRAAPVARLPRPPPRVRRDAPVRRVRPVGQPDSRGRADPAGRGRQGARVRHPAPHEVRRHEVRQDGRRCAVARPSRCSRRTRSTSSG